MSSGRQLGLLWGGVAGALLLAAPFGELIARRMPVCFFKELVGWPCATCGTTRSALALADFDPLAAFAVNPLATLAWIALIAGGLAAGTLALLGYELPALPNRLPGWARIAIVAVILANWAYLILHGT